MVAPRLPGRSRLIRYADDAVIIFDDCSDAQRVLDVLPKRFGKFGLRLHPDKTRLELAFFDPGGQRMEGAPPLQQSSSGSEALRRLNEESGQLVDWQTMPLWQGEKMNLSWSWGLVSTPRL